MNYANSTKLEVLNHHFPIKKEKNTFFRIFYKLCHLTGKMLLIYLGLMSFLAIANWEKLPSQMGKVFCQNKKNPPSAAVVPTFFSFLICQKDSPTLLNHRKIFLVFCTVLPTAIT